MEFNTHDGCYLVQEYGLKSSMFYMMFQGYHFCISMVTVYKAPFSLTRVFKTSHFQDLERADFDRKGIQYTRLNSYIFSLVQEFFRNQIYLEIRHYLVVAIE